MCCLTEDAVRVLRKLAQRQATNYHGDALDKWEKYEFETLFGHACDKVKGEILTTLRYLSAGGD